MRRIVKREEHVEYVLSKDEVLVAIKEFVESNEFEEDDGSGGKNAYGVVADSHKIRIFEDFSAKLTNIYQVED